MPDLDARLDRLFTVPLEAFVEERKALVKELRAAGEKALARDAGAMRRPTAAAWMVDHLAREGASVLEEALAAAERLGAAQAAALRGDRSALGDAMGAHRSAVEALLAHARRHLRPLGRAPTATALEHLRALVLAAAEDADLAATARAGRLVDDPEAADPFAAAAGFTPSETGARGRRGQEKGARGGKAAPGGRGKEREEAASPAGGEHEGAQEEEPAGGRRGRPKRKQRDPEQRERTLAERRAAERHEAEAGVAAAARALAARRDELDEAEDARGAARAALDQARSAAQDAEAAVKAARAACTAAERELRDRERALSALSR